MGHLYDIWTALKIKSEKFEIHFEDHFKISWLFKTMNQSGPTRLDRNERSLTAYFSESMKNKGVKFWHNLQS